VAAGAGHAPVGHPADRTAGAGNPGGT